MKSLVGYTGFVGSNIAVEGAFQGLYNTANISEAFGTAPKLLIYAGLRAEKFIAAKFPEQDKASVYEAFENIKKINPERLVLISTVDVYGDSFHKTESDKADSAEAYGEHRALLEELVKDSFSDYLIVRLPGLFGKNIKKNFIYDMINVIPGLLNEEKYAFVTDACPEIKEAYALQDNGFYKCVETDPDKREALKALFRSTGFTALNFTDSRGIFQYYDLSGLYGDISKALDKGIKILNISTEPVSIAEIYEACYGGEFVNKVAARPPIYDFRTEHFEALGGFKAADGPGGYLYSKEETLASIKTFVEVSK